MLTLKTHENQGRILIVTKTNKQITHENRGEGSLYQVGTKTNKQITF